MTTKTAKPMNDRTEMDTALEAIAEGHAIEAAEAWGCSSDEALAVEHRRVRASQLLPVVVADPPPCAPDCVPF